MISKHDSCQPFTWCYFDLMSDLYGKISLFFQGNVKNGWKGRKSMRFATNYDAVEEIIIQE